MGWIDNLVNDIPSGSHYRFELEAMDRENHALRDENARLRAELEGMKAKTVAPGRLDDEAERLLLFIAREDYASLSRIAQAVGLSREAARMYADELMKSGYIDPSYACGADAEYYLKPKAKRYLRSVALI